METTKTSNFTCQSKSLITIFFTCRVSACEPQSFSCHDLANDIHSQTAKTVFSHLNITVYVIFVCDVLTLSDNISFHFVYCSLGDLEIVLKMWTQYFYILARILTL